MSEMSTLKIQNIFLDTAPLIYFVEKHPEYISRLQPVFERFDRLASLSSRASRF